MGFRKDSYATVWSVEPETNTRTKCRISISRKNRQTGAYEQDFSGFVSFLGTSAAAKAAGLHERDRIRLGDVDVTNRYDKEKNTTYTNFSVFSFQTEAEFVERPHEEMAERVVVEPDALPVDNGENDEPNDLPF